MGSISSQVISLSYRFKNKSQFERSKGLTSDFHPTPTPTKEFFKDWDGGGCDTFGAETEEVSVWFLSPWSPSSTQYVDYFTPKVRETCRLRNDSERTNLWKQRRSLEEWVLDVTSKKLEPLRKKTYRGKTRGSLCGKKVHMLGDSISKFSKTKFYWGPVERKRPNPLLSQRERKKKKNWSSVKLTFTSDEGHGVT